MPELPEVETTRRGIAPHIVGQVIDHIIVRQDHLRWPVPTKAMKVLHKQQIKSVTRRGKYLLLATTPGTIIIHLGMSGSLRILNKDITATKHDHVDIIFTNGACLRLRDPRRFGAVLWTAENVAQHPLLKGLGPEPLSDDFNEEYLFAKTRKRKIAIKQLLMDSHVVVGVGNIYANEALFRAGIRPGLAAGRINRQRLQLLTTAIKEVLQAAIEQGGTTLRDFTASDGKPGYFKQHLFVYGRADENCAICGSLIKHIKQGQRASYYCPVCQT